MNRIGSKALVIAASLMLGVCSEVAVAERVKDLAAILGVRSNQLLGYGLVVGLVGTGDKSNQAPFTAQSLRSMLSRYGVSVPANVKIDPRNVAAVSVQSELPAFAKPGQRIDITVSSLGNAKSLRGGSLLMTTLRGADGQIYAVAQGELVVGGLDVEGNDGSKITINVPSVGRIPNGATVERTVPNSFLDSDFVMLNLHQPDFTTAQRLQDAINNAMGGGVAAAMDATSVKVRAPKSAQSRVSFVSMLESLDVEPGDAPARIVVNSRTGTVVIGSHVKVKPAAITHGNLSVTITNDPIVSQPAPFSRGGETAVVPRSNIKVTEENSRMFYFAPGVTLQEIVQAVNRVGAAPTDLVAILEALKSAGSLRAELIVI